MTRTAIDLAQVAPGFGDPVHDSQRVFRGVLDALSRPGRLVRLAAPAGTPAGLDPAAAAAVLALADGDTPLWLDGAAATAADWFRFHCGSPCVGRPEAATFAIVPGERLRLAHFDVGTTEEPERSATVIAVVRSLEPAGAWRLAGPGVNGEARARVEGLAPGFLDDWRRNGGLHPCGVDVLLAAGDLLLGLPRTVRIEA